MIYNNAVISQSDVDGNIGIFLIKIYIFLHIKLGCWLSYEACMKTRIQKACVLVYIVARDGPFDSVVVSNDQGSLDGVSYILM